MMEQKKIQSPHEYYQAYASDPTMKNITEPAPFEELFRFADRIDKAVMIFGCLCAMGVGTVLILYAQPLGQLIDAFANNKNDVHSMVEAALHAVELFGLNSLGVLIGTWLMSAAWTITSERQMIVARKSYLTSLLEQEVAWHDRNRPAQVCSKMYLQIQKVHKALVNNMTSILTKISMGVSGVILALVTGWQMGLVMIAFLPLMIVAGYVSSVFLKKMEKYQQKNKAKDDSEVIEVFDNLRTVRMLDGENYECERFEKKLNKNKRINLRHGIKNKLAFAVFFFFILVNYTLGFWYGAKLISDQALDSEEPSTYTVGGIIVIFFSIYMSNLSISSLPEYITSFSVSRVQMAKISAIVDRKSRVIEGKEEVPRKIDKICFENVHFQYENPLLTNFNLKIKKGITAFIGSSGSGKTTIINLIMRFYDIFDGKIYFESSGNQFDINTFTFESLRNRVGYVGQEPVLIGKTIREALNAQHMKDEDIIMYLKYASAWNFVKDIGIDNQFSMMSGGQKQRIAIARALINKPEILILDEGTSALDRKTEQQVMNSIRKLEIPFVLMIAHRIETIVHADIIVNLEKGAIQDQGTYDYFVSIGILEEIQMIRKKSEVQAKNEQKKSENQDEIRISKIKVMQIIEKQQKKESDEKEKQEKDQEKQFQMAYIWELVKMNSEWWYLHVFGILGSMYIGAVFPIFAYLLSQIIDVLSDIENTEDIKQLKIYQEEAMDLSLSMLALSFGALVIQSLRGISYSYLTENLGKMLKRNSFEKAINKHMTEVDEYGAQNYAHIITINCQDLKLLGGHNLGDITENSITVLVGLIIAFIFNWKITLISLCIFPLIILSGKLQMSFNHGMESSTDKSHKKTHQLVIQSIMNIKTVKSLNLKQKIMEKYSQSLSQALMMAIKYGNLGGIMFGLGQSLVSCLLALIFYIGAILIKEKQGNVLDIFTAIFAVMFAGVQTGGNLFFLSKIAASKLAACNYFQVIENMTSHELNSQIANNSRLIANRQSIDFNEQNQPLLKGEIRLHDVQFKYPNRDAAIFKNFHLDIKKSQKVALVGESGSGKSTITNLIFRIYEPVSGEITIDNISINMFTLSHLRRQIGIVSQQPILFNRSVYQNIKYNMQDATFQDVVRVSKLAQAFDFIQQGNFGILKKEGASEKNIQQASLTERESQFQREQEKTQQLEEVPIPGFRKFVGTRGSYLSGGQKQRIAIARALIRKPAILILDEATSALDNENEKSVQEALNQLNSTQIVIAHRLSTVENCDKIVVMKKGKIVEEGKYHDLLKRRGYFYNLVNAGK